jgi:peptidoglycan/LPS O-acetylase OafA/YrhL
MKSSKYAMSWKLKASILLLVFALVYLMAPIDGLPFTFFDDLAIVIVAIAIWIVAIVIETERR